MEPGKRPERKTESVKKNGFAVVFIVVFDLLCGYHSVHIAE